MLDKLMTSLDVFEHIDNTLSIEKDENSVSVRLEMLRVSTLLLQVVHRMQQGEDFELALRACASKPAA